MKKHKHEYGLFTAITMIVGIVIGSGIFFKSDNILIATGGSVSLGVFMFCIAAIGIIFGSLSVSELASRESKAGGIITYAEYSLNKSFACAFGWFHTFLYYPTLLAVVSWVTGIYTCILFGLKGTLELQIIIGFSVMAFLFLVNILSAKLGGYFQNTATIIKLIPLILIALIGLLFGDVSSISVTDVTQMESVGWITAIAPIAFSFDGWIVASSIGHEMKNPKKDLPKALVLAPIFILIVYVLYFIGISIYVGPETVMKLGDAHVDLAANNIFGPMGAKLIIIFVIISIMGTVNGLIMGLSRMPYSLALRGMFPKVKGLTKISNKYGISVKSAVIAFILSVIAIIVHYLTQKFNMLPNSDISEISITINYVLFIVLYIKVFRMGCNGEITGVWRGKINPILATCGSLLILIGSISNPLFGLYAVICSIVLVSAIIFWKRKE
ncbi:APC family permease [Clostridium tarantellae]|uniref:Amino acid permease n=1 Tax=Clostridium tarantellae TaxID=39493 RepID=A0A6I1MMD6_9CLOT|nr:APC family permease [Clostridium tarantellae]MPQ43618.1 amino acid permease [Clostridium tarantellae]